MRIAVFDVGIFHTKGRALRLALRYVGFTCLGPSFCWKTSP